MCVISQDTPTYKTAGHEDGELALRDQASVEVNLGFVGRADALDWPYETKALCFTALTNLHKRLLGSQRATRFGLDVAHCDPLVPPWPDLIITAGWRPARIALARHVLRAAQLPQLRTKPRLALEVAVACNAMLEYACALEQARAGLRMRPAHRGAFWLASEITARRRLGVLLFEGREYLDGFQPLEPAEAWLSRPQLRELAARGAR